MHNTYSSPPIVSWTDSLARILRMPSYDQYLSSNAHLILRRSPRHPAGEIWKHTFSVCVYSDLEFCEVSRKNRRFARLEDRGLSGIILYEVPVIPGADGHMHPSFTLEEAFGREENEYEDGMSVTELLDSTNARLVYFPAYACTSFFIGQVMHAFLTDDHRLRPRPAINGFFVYPERLDGSEDPKEIGTGIEGSQITAQLNNDHDFDDSSSSRSDEQDQVDEKCNSSLDSFGPETPPRLDSPPIQEFTKRKTNTTVLD